MTSRYPTRIPPARLSRRVLLGALPLCLAAPGLRAQRIGIVLSKLHWCEIRVSDVGRSVGFYQGLFGMPVQSRSTERTFLRIGDGPQCMAVRPVAGDEVPGIARIGYSVEGFDADGALRALSDGGFQVVSAPPAAARGIDYALQCWIEERDGVREVYFADARGLIVQLCAPGYCGGSGAVGDRCPAPEPVADGLMRLEDFNHFTVFVNDGAEANRFYQDAFGLAVQAYQGPRAPVTGIGDGFQFVMYAGPARDDQVPANIHHGCFNMRGFDVERVRSLLSNYGLSARDEATADPLMHYVSLRMPERGGAEGGTPELYFTDPDGILMQLQDVSYCGGGGYFGSECLPG